LICIEGKGGLKDNHCIAQNAALFVDLLLSIFYLFIYLINSVNNISLNEDKKDKEI
jgi:hypothetical protein